MSDKVFIDTNIFIYTQRTDSPDKSKIAEDIINRSDCVASTQVLNEIANVFTKKYPIAVDKLECLIKNICEISEIVVINEALISKALSLHNIYKAPYFDCLMIAAALFSDCDILYSEDMHNGLVIEDKLEIVNPFV